MCLIVKTALICLAMVTFFTGCSKNDPIITSIDDVKNAKIGVTVGTTSEAVAI